MIVYKVCRKESGRFVSAFIGLRNESSLTTSYPVGKEVEAVVGKLFVFSSFRKALNWVSGRTNEHALFVLQCETDEATFLKRRIMQNCVDIKYNAWQWWNREATQAIHVTVVPPKGTMVCKRLRVIKRIKGTDLALRELIIKRATK